LGDKIFTNLITVVLGASKLKELQACQIGSAFKGKKGIQICCFMRNRLCSQRTLKGEVSLYG